MGKNVSALSNGMHIYMRRRCNYLQEPSITPLEGILGD